MREDTYYSQTRSELLSLIPGSAKRILEVGCGEGVLGESLLRRGADTVVGIELDPAAASEARRRLTQVIEQDVEKVSFPLSHKGFDAIICADVLEHLVDPWETLKSLASCLMSDGRLIASIPNVRYLALVDHLANGNWTYSSSGLLDAGHLRFFTLAEINEMFEKAGLTITALHGNMGPLYADFKDQPQKNEIRFGRVHIRDLTLEEFNEFFVFQYLVQAKHINP